jgi:RNA dependent RNA polymerase
MYVHRICNQKIVDISPLVKRLHPCLVSCDKFNLTNIKNIANTMENEQRVLVQELMTFEHGKSVEFSLLSDLHRYFQVIDEKHLKEGNVSIFLQLCTMGDFLSIESKSWYGLEIIKHEMNSPDMNSFQLSDCPFIICFESERLGRNIDLSTFNKLPQKVSTVCEYLFHKTEQCPAMYLKTLHYAEMNNIPISNTLTFRAELQENGKLQLFEPEKSADRRIFRMYGSDRFLEISFASRVPGEIIIKFLLNPVQVGNRMFRFFWFKREDSIRAVLFAENGTNIKKVLVSDVRERCIPTNDNHEMTLGKWVKRMKLNFSTTTVGCMLPAKSVSILNNFEKDDVAEIDGAGLVSSLALQSIWDGYNKYIGNDQNDICPYSGFQGRLAGYVFLWYNPFYQLILSNQKCTCTTITDSKEFGFLIQQYQVFLYSVEKVKRSTMFP